MACILKPDTLVLAGKAMSLDRPLLMGVLNTTPDSFSDGGHWFDAEKALRHALEMISAGADIIDIGGESTRPGAHPVPLEEELNRVIPLIERLRTETDVPLSIDTSKPQVMREAVRAGAGMVNDVFALQMNGALEMASILGVPICLMHMSGRPHTMQDTPSYDDVVAEVISFLAARVVACQEVGIPADAIVLDPGFGFGKTLQNNLDLFHAIPRFCELGFPLLVGVSRKTMLGEITGKAVDRRLPASIVAAVLAARYGASILRVHDVGETRDALRTADALGPGGVS